MTCMDVQAALDQLVSNTQPGDTLFFHFSGHGTQVPSDDPSETDGLDEAIVPTDMNIIVDDDLRVILCKVPLGSHLTMLADCCHSGTMLDHKLCKLGDGAKAAGQTTVRMPLPGRSINKCALGSAYKPCFLRQPLPFLSS